MGSFNKATFYLIHIGVDFTLLFGYREAFGHQAKVKYKV